MDEEKERGPGAIGSAADPAWPVAGDGLTLACLELFVRFEAELRLTDWSLSSSSRSMDCEAEVEGGVQDRGLRRLSVEQVRSLPQFYFC